MFYNLALDLHRPTLLIMDAATSLSLPDRAHTWGKPSSWQKVEKVQAHFHTLCAEAT